MAFAKEAGCYKAILDCGEERVPFYEKCGLARKEVQMVRLCYPHSALVAWQCTLDSYIFRSLRNIM